MRFGMQCVRKRDDPMHILLFETNMVSFPCILNFVGNCIERLQKKNLRTKSEDRVRYAKNILWSVMRVFQKKT